jgi:hypothetical protein
MWTRIAGCLLVVVSVGCLGGPARAAEGDPSPSPTVSATSEPTTAQPSPTQSPEPSPTAQPSPVVVTVTAPASAASVDCSHAEPCWVRLRDPNGLWRDGATAASIGVLFLLLLAGAHVVGSWRK